MSEIRKIRKALGMTAEDLAKIVGVHPLSIYRYETGHREPGISIANKIAKALHCTIEDLIDKESA